MLVRPWEEDDARGSDDDRLSFGVSDCQSSLFERMKVPGLFVQVRGDPTEGSGVEHPGGESELLEEGGEEVHVFLGDARRYMERRSKRQTYHLMFRCFRTYSRCSDGYQSLSKTLLHGRLFARLREIVALAMAQEKECPVPPLGTYGIGDNYPAYSCEACAGRPII